MKVIVEGLAVECLDEGAGPVILLLHGWGNTLRYFDTLCAELPGFRLVRADMPGFGASQQPEHAWSVEEYARFVAAFCEKLQLAPEAMLGHSFGGRILTKGVGANILHPQKMILVASAGVAERTTARNSFYAALAKVGRVLLAPLPASVYAHLRRALYTRTGSDYLTTGAMSETFLKMIREDLSTDAARIRVPTLLIWGENDEITPLSEAAKLHTLIDGSQLRTIPGAGHFVYRDDPVHVAGLIKQFIS